jgi:hypothetical protein
MAAALWVASCSAEPLASRSIGEVAALAQKFNNFLNVFDHFQKILQHGNTTVEFYDDFLQTWDECNDFFSHNPTLKEAGTITHATTLHASTCYVYTNDDLGSLSRRLNLQLHIMNAKIDLIIL